MTQRIVMVTIGSRGDVQPFVALGKGLKQAGYETTVATHANFEDFVTSNGLDFTPLPGDPHELSKTLASDKAGANTYTFMTQLNRWMSGFLDELLIDLDNACEPADLIMAGFLSMATPPIAEKYNVPMIWQYNFPLFQQTAAYPSTTAFLPQIDVGWMNRFSYRAERLMGYYRRPMVNHWRTETLGLPAYSWFKVFPYDTINGQPISKLYAYSPSLLPVPDDNLPHMHVTGYWFLPHQDTFEPPPELVEFLDAGEPPVYVGFGSLIDRHATEMVERIIEAALRTGNRLILLGGWAELTPAAQVDHVFTIQNIPHDWLFPRMKAVAHHGGAGTTAAGLRAGVPSIIVPFFGDQVYWGNLIYKHKLGPKPVPARKLTTDNFAEALHIATKSEQIRENASKMGESIRAEDGISNAIKIIQSILN